MIWNGHGTENGDWLLNSREKVTLDAIWTCWERRFEKGGRLSLIADCCYGGKWVERARARRLDLTVHSASSSLHKTIDGAFSSIFTARQNATKDFELYQLANEPMFYSSVPTHGAVLSVVTAILALPVRCVCVIAEYADPDGWLPFSPAPNPERTRTVHERVVVHMKSCTRVISEFERLLNIQKELQLASKSDLEAKLLACTCEMLTLLRDSQKNELDLLSLDSTRGKVTELKLEDEIARIFTTRSVDELQDESDELRAKLRCLILRRLQHLMDASTASA